MVPSHWPRRASSSEPVSQLALNTQFPYNPSQLLSTPPSPQTPALQLPQPASVDAALLAAQPELLHPSTQQSPQAQDKRQSPVDLFKKPRLVLPAHNDGENSLTSSNESIECQPYIPPAAVTSPEHSSQVGQLHHGATDDPQPFPLVDWIKQIRKDTWKHSPILPIRWASSISQRQQAILHSHDTWLPPLAGKPRRPGSLPLHLLDRLTNRADDGAARQPRPHPEPAKDKSTEATALVHLPEPQSLSQHPAPQPAPDHDSDRDSDKATVEASQWSSSLPSPRVPPDSDPVTEPYQQVKNKPQVDEARLETIDEDHLASQLAQSEEQPDSFARQPPHEPAGPEASSHSNTEHGHEVGVNEAVTCRSDIRSNSVVDPSTETPAIRQPEPQTVRTTSVTKVQVKDTPYPLKDLHMAPPPTALPDDDPPSSFVGATYPELPPTRSRRDLLTKNPVEAHSVVFTQSEELGARQPHPAPQSLEWPINNEDDRDGLNQIQRPPPNNEDAMNTNNLTTGAVPSRSVDRTPNSDHEAAPPRKRQKLERPSNIRLSEYQKYDNQRMLDRRKFLRSISTSWTNAGPEDSETFLRHNNQLPAKTSSQASSPPVSAKHSNAAASEGITTSATNLSIHDSHLLRTPARRPASRMSSFNVDIDNNHLVSTFSQFRHAYPDYPGNQKSFRSALQLLLRLQSQPREPHPSMWDDFIFRMAKDYKQYLVECIDDDESAIEYQDYYYTRVRRSERTREVVTEDVLLNLTENVRLDRLHVPSSRLRYSRSVSSFQVANDIEMSDAARPSTELIRAGQQAQARELPTMQDRPTSSARMAHRGKEMDEREIPETQAIPAEQTVQDSRQSPPPQPAIAQPAVAQAAAVITKSAAKKRRSLPWDAAKTNTIAEPSRMPLQKISNTSSTQSSTSSKVEQWLLTSRAVGAASPELEAMELPTLTQDARKSTPTHGNEVPPPRQSADVITAVADITPSIESPAARAPKLVRRPETRFTSFVANYAQLQSEKAFYSSSAKKKRVPINIYDW